MKVLRCVAVSMLVVVLATMAHSSCCYPEQFESYGVGIMEEMEAGTRIITQGHGNISYDYLNRQVAMKISLQVNGTAESYMFDVVLKNLKLYIISLWLQTCIVLPADPMEASCIPDDAQQTGIRYIGTGSQSFQATSYRYTDSKKSGPTRTNYATVTSTECADVTRSTYGSVSDMFVMTAAEYFNTTLGIVDPSVFDVSAECGETNTYADNVVKEWLMGNKGLHKFGGEFNPFWLFSGLNIMP